ncbi:MAG: FtsQ-type POTRA domain-containing protein [Patescibacteria group bacterium]
MDRYLQHGYRDELRSKRKKRKIRVAFLVVSSLATFIIFGAYALFFSGWFSVKGIELSGNQEISEEEIKKITKPFSNILFSSSKKIEDSLKENFPIIGQADVSKNFFNKYLSVRIDERKAAGIWCKSGQDQCFYLDKDGFLFKPAARFSGEALLAIEDGRERDFNLTDSLDDREFLEKINSAKKILDELKIVAYNNFFLAPGSFEFWIKTKEGWYVYLDKESDIPTQLVALKKFLEEKLPADRRQNLQYIDLRVNNRIYYR